MQRARPPPWRIARFAAPFCSVGGAPHRAYPHEFGRQSAEEAVTDHVGPCPIVASGRPLWRTGCDPSLAFRGAPAVQVGHSLSAPAPNAVRRQMHGAIRLACAPKGLRGAAPARLWQHRSGVGRMRAVGPIRSEFDPNTQLEVGRPSRNRPATRASSAESCHTCPRSARLGPVSADFGPTRSSIQGGKHSRSRVGPTAKSIAQS